MGEKTSLEKLGKKYTLTADQLSAVKSVFTLEQLQLLHSPTPKEHIHQFPKDAGKMAGLSFVTGGYMKHMLDRLTGGMWSFEIKEKGNAAGQVWVLGRVTLYKEDGNTLIFKEQFGRASIKFKKGTKDALDIGNDMKAAATDALKKCASELGIARDVYSANEFIEANIVERKDVEDLQDMPVTEEPTPKGKPVIDDAFKAMVTSLLMELYPLTHKRIQYLKEFTGKDNLRSFGDYDWDFVYQDLKGKKLAKAAAAEEQQDAEQQ